MARILLPEQEFIREHSTVLVFSVLLHLALLALLAVNLNLMPLRKPQPQRLAIQATVVDQAAIRRRAVEKERQQQAAAAAVERRRQEELARERRIEEARRAQAEREEQRQAQEERRRQEAEQARLDTERRKAAQKKQAAAEEARKAEQRKQAAADAARKAEQQKKQAAAEAARKAEQQKQAAAEAARKAEAQRRQTQREADLASQLAAEEELLAAADSGQLDQYAEIIRQKVERNWIRPASARQGLNCVVLVRQIPGGEVVEVRVTECNGDAAVVRSIEAAVLRSSPLPAPPNPALFDRSLRFEFRPQD